MFMAMEPVVEVCSSTETEMALDFRRFACAMARNRSLARAMCSGRVPIRLSSTTRTCFSRINWNSRDIRNGSLPVAGPIERRHAAKSAVHGTTARGLNGSEGISSGQQIMPGGRYLVYLGEPVIIPALQAAMPGIRQNLRPDALGFPRDDRVHTLPGLVQAHGCMNAAMTTGTPRRRK